MDLLKCGNIISCIVTTTINACMLAIESSQLLLNTDLNGHRFSKDNVIFDAKSSNPKTKDNRENWEIDDPRFNEVSINFRKESKVAANNLADDNIPFEKLLSGLSRKRICDAAPFFLMTEFDPRAATDEGILLKVLNYEFDELDNLPPVEPYGRYSLSNIFEKWILGGWGFGWIRHFGFEITDDEYIAKFPWDRFYEPELYKY